MRQYHQLYKFVPQIRCWSPGPGVVPAVIAVPKSVTPRVCLWALASAPCRMLLCSARRKKEKPALMLAWCVSHKLCSSRPRATQIRTTSVTMTNHEHSLYWALSTSQTPCWALGDNGYSRHKARNTQTCSTHDACSRAHHQHHGYLTGDLSSKPEEQLLYSWGDGWGARTALGILSCIKGLGTPPPLQIELAGTIQNLMESSAPGVRTFC